MNLPFDITITITKIKGILPNLSSGWLVILLCFTYFVYMFLPFKRRKLPPGPPRRFLIGNLLDIPKSQEFLKFTEWRHQYGDVVSLSALGNTIIILNAAEMANDLLQKRFKVYSGRPRLVMAGELVGYDKTLVLSQYDDRLKKMRRYMHQALTYEIWPLQERETKRFLNLLLNEPQHFLKHIRHNAGAIILKISHGYDVAPQGEDPFVNQAEIAVNGFSEASRPGVFLVDILPFLKYVPSWFPGGGFRRKASQWRMDLYKMMEGPHVYVKKQMAKNTASLSVASLHLQHATTPEEEDFIKWTTGSLYSAGADTTVSAVTTFFLAMCLHPEAQRKAQEELDRVIGGERLPQVVDRPSLPYVEAILKEVLRWCPVVPGGVPHILSEEDKYAGYNIPAKSIIISNIWAMSRDPRYFPDPEEFRPERYLGDNKQTALYADPLRFIFGIGRRICPGQRLAEPSVFLAIAMFLAVFNIEKARDSKTGEVIEPTREFISGTILQHKPFQCAIVPRSESAINLIKKANRECAPRDVGREGES